MYSLSPDERIKYVEQKLLSARTNELLVKLRKDYSEAHDRYNRNVSEVGRVSNYEQAYVSDVERTAQYMQELVDIIPIPFKVGKTFLRQQAVNRGLKATVKVLNDENTYSQ